MLSYDTSIFIDIGACINIFILQYKSPLGILTNSKDLSNIDDNIVNMKIIKHLC